MSAKKPDQASALPAPAPSTDANTQALHAEVRAVLAEARQQVWRNVNHAMVRAYWQVGQLIVQHEQAGQARAAYGARVLDELASRLTAEFGKGFAVQSLRNFRQFYLTVPDAQIRSTPWSELTWSHLKALMRVTNPEARAWYASEAVAQTWSVAALARQISTLYFERLLSSQDKPAVQAEAAALIAAQAAPNPRDFIRDPYVLDFLGAQPGAALFEKDLEQGLLDQLQKLLLELGKGFAFVTRLKHLRIEEFAVEQAWWGSEADGFAARVEGEFAWKVSADDITGRNDNLDCKNPHVGEQVSHDPAHLLAEHARMQEGIHGRREQLKAVLDEALERDA